MVHFLEILTIPLHLSFYCPHRGHAVLTAGRVGRLWRKESLLLTRLYRDVPFLQSLQSVELFYKIYKRQIDSRGNFFVVFNFTLNKANYKQKYTENLETNSYSFIEQKAHNPKGKSVLPTSCSLFYMSNTCIALKSHLWCLYQQQKLCFGVYMLEKTQITLLLVRDFAKSPHA